jgi:hypothetical protein
VPARIRPNEKAMVSSLSSGRSGKVAASLRYRCASDVVAVAELSLQLAMDAGSANALLASGGSESESGGDDDGALAALFDALAAASTAAPVVATRSHFELWCRRRRGSDAGEEGGSEEEEAVEGFVSYSDRNQLQFRAKTQEQAGGQPSSSSSSWEPVSHPSELEIERPQQVAGPAAAAAAVVSPEDAAADPEEGAAGAAAAAAAAADRPGTSLLVVGRELAAHALLPPPLGGAPSAAFRTASGRSDDDGAAVQRGGGLDEAGFSARLRSCLAKHAPEWALAAVAAVAGVSRGFPSWKRSILTEIYLYVTPVLVQKLRMDTPGQAPPLRRRSSVVELSWQHGGASTASCAVVADDAAAADDDTDGAAGGADQVATRRRRSINSLYELAVQVIGGSTPEMTGDGGGQRWSLPRSSKLAHVTFVVQPPPRRDGAGGTGGTAALLARQQAFDAAAGMTASPSSSSSSAAAAEGPRRRQSAGGTASLPSSPRSHSHHRTAPSVAEVQSMRRNLNIRGRGALVLIDNRCDGALLLVPGSSAVSDGRWSSPNPGDEEAATDESKNYFTGAREYSGPHSWLSQGPDGALFGGGAAVAGGPPARIEPNQLVVFGSESLGGMSATGATVVYQLADGSGSAVRAPVLACRGGSTEIPLRFFGAGWALAQRLSVCLYLSVLVCVCLCLSVSLSVCRRSARACVPALSSRRLAAGRDLKLDTRRSRQPAGAHVALPVSGEGDVRHPGAAARYHLRVTVVMMIGTQSGLTEICLHFEIYRYGYGYPKMSVRTLTYAAARSRYGDRTIGFEVGGVVHVAAPARAAPGATAPRRADGERRQEASRRAVWPAAAAAGSAGARSQLGAPRQPGPR